MDADELELRPKKKSPKKRPKKLTAEQLDEKRDEATAALQVAARKGHISEIAKLVGGIALQRLSAQEQKERSKERNVVEADVNAVVERSAAEGRHVGDPHQATTALVEAVFYDHLDAVNLLLECDADPSLEDGSGWTPLIAAAEQGLLPIMRRLLKAPGIDVDALDPHIGCSAFHFAGVMGHRECTELLVRNGCDTEMQAADGTTGLELAKDVATRAARRGRTAQLAREERERAAAAGGGDDGRVDREVLYMDDEGKWQAGEKKVLGWEESMHAAAVTGDLPMLQRLLMVAVEKGIDINELDQHGQTPLYLAVSAGQLHMAKIFLINHANPYMKGTNGSAPIHGAARHGQLECVETLLERKADVNVRGVHGRTPLILAAASGHVGTVRVLLHHGGDPHITDNDSRSAIDLAANLHIIHLLKRTVEKKLSQFGRYEVPEGEAHSSLGSCAGVCEGTQAIDTVTGEHVVILRFADAVACERMHTAIRALHGTYGGGFGAINNTPPPWVTPSEGDESEEDEAPQDLGLLISSSDDEDNDAEEDPIPEEQPEPEPEPEPEPVPEPAARVEQLPVIATQAWGMTLGDYVHSKRNAMPLVEVRAVLRALLYSLSSLHSASLAHGVVTLQTVARYWDGSWRLIDLHRVRHQGMNSDPVLLEKAEAEADHQADEAEDVDGNGNRTNSVGGMLAKERERAGQSNGGPVIPLKLPSIPPEGVRRVSAAGDMWSVGVLALGMLTRVGRKHSLPVGRAATADSYWDALEQWMKPLLQSADPKINRDAVEMIEGCVSALLIYQALACSTDPLTILHRCVAGKL